MDEDEQKKNENKQQMPVETTFTSTVILQDKSFDVPFLPPIPTPTSYRELIFRSKNCA